MAITLIVEDGSKPANANSYCSIEFANDYHELMDNAAWAKMSDTVKTSALVKATASIELLYGPRYLSNRWPGVQSLLWPRYVFVDRHSIIRTNDEIPVELKRAVAVHALNIVNGTNPFPMKNQEVNVKRKKTKVGEIESEVEYRQPVEQEQFDGYNQVELLLQPILRNKLSTDVGMSR